MRLTPQQLEAFETDGFLVLPGVFDAEEVAVISEAFDHLVGIAARLRQPTLHDNSLFVVDGAQIKRVVWCSGAASALQRWRGDARLVGPAAQLLATTPSVPLSALDQLICQAHFKLPKDGVAFPWHQDARHRRYGTDLWRDVNGRGSFVQTLLAIDAMGPGNGGLRFVRGSHHLGYLAPDELERRIDPAHIVSLEMAPGALALFGPFAVHGSLPNDSSTARRVWINGFACPGANGRDYPGCGLGDRLVL